MGQCKTSCNKMLNKEQSEEEIHHMKSNLHEQVPDTAPINTSVKKTYSPINQQNMQTTSNTGQATSASTLVFSMKENNHVSVLNNQTQSGGQATNYNPQSSSQVSSLTQLGKQGVTFMHTQTEKEQSQKQGTIPELQQEISMQESMKKSQNKESSYEEISSPVLRVIKVQFRACVSIFYGTMGGTASELAFNLAAKCEQGGFYVKVIRLLHFEPWMVRACQVSIFILASQGQQRGPTDDAQQFYFWLNNFDNQHSPLKNLKFACFGLYNSLSSKKGGNDTTELDSTNYLESIASPSPEMQQQPQSDLAHQDNNPNASRFNIALNKKPTPIKSMGQRIDMVLEEIGAQRFMQLRQIDSSKPDLLTEAFKNYSNGLVDALLMAYPQNEITENEAYNQALPFRISLNSQQDKNITKNNEESRKKELDRQYSTQGRNGKKSYPLREEMWEYFSGWSASVQKLEFQRSIVPSKSNSSSLPQVEFMNISLDASAGEIFETGGQVELFPENDHKSVETLIKVLDLEENTQIQVTSQQTSLPVEFRSPMPSPLFVQQYLKEFIDMHGPIDQSQVYELSAFCANKSDTQKLRQLCQFDRKAEFEREITTGATPSLFELIVAYQICVPLPLLCGLSRLLKPRTYVISSSNIQKPLTLSFIVKLQQSSNNNNNPSNSKNQGQIQQKPKMKCVTTEYIKELHSLFNNNNKKNISMRVKCSSNPLWRLPLKDKNIRIIFICLEEGIGLCRAFIQESQAIKNANGNEIHLFYGCRELEDGNYLLSSEIAQWNKENLIQSTSIALTNSSGETKNIFKQNELPKSSLRLSRSIPNNLANSSNNIHDSSHNINNSNNISERNNNMNQDPSSKPSSKLLVQESLNDKHDASSQKSNWSPLQVLIENQLVQFSKLIENIAEKDENIKIFICGSQLLSQGVLGAIAKAYSLISKQTQYAAFSSVLDFENDSKIVRVTWTYPENL